jgi:hypothetical protein
LRNGPKDANVADAQAEQKRTADLTAQLQAASQELAAALRANDELTSRGILQAARKDLAAALKADDELMARQNTLLAEVEGLKRQLAGDASTVQRITDLEGQLAAARKGLLADKNSQSETERRNRDQELLRAQNQALTEANLGLERQVRSNADFPRQRADSQAMIEELKRANTDLQVQIVSLNGRLAQAAMAAPVAGPSAEDLTRAKDELNRANSKVEMTIRGFVLLQKENEQLKAKLAQIADAVSAAAAVPAAGRDSLVTNRIR